MTRELIIEGQHVDLSADTDITLEYVNNIVGDMGQINLSHSYTVKLPKTLQNARVLDDPGNTSRESGATRRYLSARYYRNGIDLIGPAQAYILKTTPESYEVALIWNTLEALQALSQYSGTLNDLQSLPVLKWIGSNGTTPDYTGTNDKAGALFAFYNSGLGGVKYPTVNAATHPCMSAATLLNNIFSQAGVPLELSDKARQSLNNLVVLAAPNHRPTREMEIESGSTAGTVKLTLTVNGSSYVYGLSISDWTYGWDAPQTYGAIPSKQIGYTLETGSNSKHRILLNLSTNVNMKGSSIYIEGLKFDTSGDWVEARETLLTREFQQGPDGRWYLFVDEELNVSGWPFYAIDLSYAGESFTSGVFSAYDIDLPLLAANRVHDIIQIAKDNRFPLEGNLPDIKQWEFVKACAAVLGWVPVIQKGKVQMSTYDELLDTSGAYDWTSKVDMTDGGLQDLGYTLDKWAQANDIVFQENETLQSDPVARLHVQDSTITEHRDLYKLPFAASLQSSADHYKVDGTKVEDVNIEPRIFRVVNKNGSKRLEFTEDLYGDGLIGARYARLQEVIRKPVRITVNIRLHEIDLAQLDLTRAVYLGQYGKYYAILKIQTSDTDLCKVELLQLP